MPIIVVLAPLFVLVLVGILLFVWIKGKKATPTSPIQSPKGWTDWLNADGLRLRVRPLLPEEAPNLTDEWHAQVDMDESQPLLYAETFPPLESIHGAIISGFRYGLDDGVFVQKVWFVEDEDPALDSEIVFIDTVSTEAQVVTTSGPFLYTGKQAAKSLILEGSNHDERHRITISLEE
ncbi:MAG: hypothetical protein AB8F95_14015 [Bacteroidia bacterium]